MERTVLVAQFQDPNNGWPCLAMYEGVDQVLHCLPCFDTDKDGRYEESLKLCADFNRRRGWGECKTVDQAHDLLRAALRQQDPDNREIIDFS